MMIYRTTVMSLLGLVILAIGGVSVSTLGPVLTTPAEVRKGRQFYIKYCAACHGQNGEGPSMAVMRAQVGAGLISPPPHDSTGHTWQHPDEDILMVMQQGRGHMLRFSNPPMEAEARAILAYIKTLWTPEQRRQQAALQQH